MKPKLLDLYCGAGGCTKGYQRAGFYVIGVDSKPQPRYCGDDFFQGDALAVLKTLLTRAGRIVAASGNEYRLEDFAAIHASPPCQTYSVTRHLPNVRKDHPDMLSPTRELLLRTGKPWIIENVPGAPLHFAVMLCGVMFPELRVQRHRWFETSFFVWQPVHPPHKVKLNTHRWCQAQRTSEWQTVAGHAFGMKAAKRAMGIDWMIRDELSQAIPPAYTEYIGRQLNHHA